ncbi:MAG TPA: hypothetical protein VFT62_02120 [Mycobacteriales bacterium]|nr:hypothetical protein [Mycobacteriales bacterium]
MQVLASACRHGIITEDALHAVEQALAVEEVGDDPLRFLVLGPDRAGNLLEFAVMDRPQGPAVIHAMPMRPKYRRLLPKGGS